MSLTIEPTFKNLCFLGKFPLKDKWVCNFMYWNHSLLPLLPMCFYQEICEEDFLRVKHGHLWCWEWIKAVLIFLDRSLKQFPLCLYKGLFLTCIPRVRMQRAEINTDISKLLKGWLWTRFKSKET